MIGSALSRWGGGLPREGVGADKFSMSLETRENQTFLAGYPAILPGYPRAWRLLRLGVRRSIFLGGSSISGLFEVIFWIARNRRGKQTFNLLTSLFHVFSSLREVPEKFEKKRFVFNSRSLVKGKKTASNDS